jgi:hypothetical protein
MLKYGNAVEISWPYFAERFQHERSCFDSTGVAIEIDLESELVSGEPDVDEV